MPPQTLEEVNEAIRVRITTLLKENLALQVSKLESNKGFESFETFSSLSEEEKFRKTFQGTLIKARSAGPLGRLGGDVRIGFLRGIPGGEAALKFIFDEQGRELIRPEGLSGALAQGGAQVATELPQIFGLTGVLGKSKRFQQLGRLSKSLVTGTVFGGAKGAISGEPETIVPRAIGTGLTFVAFGKAGEIGSKASRLIPKALIRKIGPIAGQRVINVASKTGAITGGAGVGAALGIGAPSEEQVASTILGGALGLMGTKSPRQIRFALRPGKTRVPISRQLPDLRKDPTIQRINQLTQEKLQLLDRQVAEELESIARIPRASKEEMATIQRASDFQRQADKADHIASDLARVGDFTEALNFGRQAKRLRELIPTQPTQLGGGQKPLRSAVEIAMEKPLGPKTEIPREVIESIAQREAITEVLIKAQEGHISAQEPALAEAIQKAELTGLSESVRFPLLDAQTKQTIIDSVVKAPPIKGIDLQTTEFIRIAQELDGGNPGVRFVTGPHTEMFKNILKQGGEADRNARVVMIGLLKKLKSFGFKVRLDGKINKQESRRFRDFIERVDPTVLRFGKRAFLNRSFKTTFRNKPFSDIEIKKFSQGEKEVRKILDSYYTELNEFLSASGQSMARYVNDYLPWIAEIDASRYLTGDGTATARLSSKFERPEHAPFKFKNPRGRERPVNPIDAIRAVEDYVNRAEIAKASEKTIQEVRFRAEVSRKLKDGERELEGQKRYDTYSKFMDNFADTLTGMTDRHSIDLLLRDHPMGRAVGWVNSRWVSNVLTSFGPFINQVLSVPALAGSEVGLTRAFKGSTRAGMNEFWGMIIRHVSNPAYETFAAQHSLVYNARLHAGEGRLIARRTNVIGRFFDSITGSMDRVMVAGAFNTGYRYGRRTLGLGHENAVTYGDVLAARTNAVFNRALKPAFLQSRAGSIIAPLNTSIFASMNLMFRDGISNPELPLGVKISRVGKMFASAVLIRMALEQFRKSPGNVFEDAFLDNIPLIGSMARFGGPGVFSSFTRFFQGKSPRSKTRGAILLFGPRGSFQLTKTFEGIKATLEDGIVRGKDGEELYRFDTRDLAEVLRAVTFSPSGTKAGEAFFDKVFPGFVRGTLQAFDIIDTK